MKKKILICVGIFLTITTVFLFCFVGSIKKSPLTPEKYISIMNSNNIQVQDDTKTLDENSKQAILRVISADDFASFA